MGKTLYVGNLHFSIDDSSLSNHFAQFGRVRSAKVVVDFHTKESRGFGFVKMSTEEEAGESVAKLNGTELEGRTLRVDKAREREPRVESRKIQ